MLRTFVLLGVLLPHAVCAQVVSGGLRAGTGWDRTGETVYAGQLEIVEFGRWSSVEVGISALEGGTAEDYRTSQGLGAHSYHEETHVRGLALTASVLLWHPPRDSRGPYLLFGLGVGPIDVEWRTDSATDARLGAPLVGGGSFATEGSILVGSMGNAGIGMRVHRHIDLRAQALSLIVPSTDAREDMKIVSTFTLSAGITL